MSMGGGGVVRGGGDSLPPMINWFSFSGKNNVTETGTMKVLIQSVYSK